MAGYALGILPHHLSKKTQIHQMSPFEPFRPISHNHFMRQMGPFPQTVNIHRAAAPLYLHKPSLSLHYTTPKHTYSNETVQYSLEQFWFSSYLGPDVGLYERVDGIF